MLLNEETGFPLNLKTCGELVADLMMKHGFEPGIKTVL